MTAPPDSHSVTASDDQCDRGAAPEDPSVVGATPERSACSGGTAAAPAPAPEPEPRSVAAKVAEAMRRDEERRARREGGGGAHLPSRYHAPPRAAQPDAVATLPVA